jgi:hypothetical protein
MGVYLGTISTGQKHDQGIYGTVLEKPHHPTKHQVERSEKENILLKRTTEQA